MRSVILGPSIPAISLLSWTTGIVPGSPANWVSSGSIIIIVVIIRVIHYYGVQKTTNRSRGYDNSIVLRLRLAGHVVIVFSWGLG